MLLAVLSIVKSRKTSLIIFKNVPLRFAPRWAPIYNRSLLYTVLTRYLYHRSVTLFDSLYKLFIFIVKIELPRSRGKIFHFLTVNNFLWGLYSNCSYSPPGTVVPQRRHRQQQHHQHPNIRTNRHHHWPTTENRIRPTSPRQNTKRMERMESCHLQNNRPSVKHRFAPFNTTDKTVCLT